MVAVIDSRRTELDPICRPAFLWDVNDAASRIREFVVGHNFETFTASVLVQSAVERQFEVIGEALKQGNSPASAGVGENGTGSSGRRTTAKCDIASPWDTRGMAQN